MPIISNFLMIICIFLSQFQVILTRDHICTHLATGHIERLNLKSFAHTRHHIETDLLLFESDQVYWIDRASITPTGFPLQEVSYQWNSSKSYGPLRELSLPSDSGSIKTISLINNEREGVHQAIIVTTKHELLFNAKGNLISKSGRVHAEYSLTLNEWSQGYVLQTDKDLPQEIVIYDFNYTFFNEDKPIDLHIRFSKSPSNLATFFYLYRAENAPNFIRFIYPTHLKEQQDSSSSGPLFGDHQYSSLPPPPGFIHNNHVYLFDTARGCIYVITYYPGLKQQAKRQTSFLYPRRNIPFERFFGCDKKFSMMTKGLEKIVLDSERCQEDPIWQNPRSNYAITILNEEHHESSLTMPFIISIILVVLILFGGVFYVLVFRNEDPALNQDWEAQIKKEKRKKTKRGQAKKPTKTNAGEKRFKQNNSKEEKSSNSRTLNEDYI